MYVEGAQCPAYLGVRCSAWFIMGTFELLRVQPAGDKKPGADLLSSPATEHATSWVDYVVGRLFTMALCKVENERDKFCLNVRFLSCLCCLCYPLKLQPQSSFRVTIL